MKKYISNIKTPNFIFISRAVTWLLIFSATIIVWVSFAPPILNLIRDDSMVLPERAWASSNLDWLWHLLFFSQNRYTAGGDYFLFRPVLFLHTWYMDVLYREDRSIHYWVSVSIGFFTAGTVFWINKKRLPLIIAASLGLIFLIYPNDRIVFQWSHISPYLLALVFHGVGIYYLINDLFCEKSRLSLRGIVFLLLGSLCHELVPVSIFTLIVYAYFSKDRDRQFLIKNLSIALIIFLAFYAFVITWNTNWPGFFSHGEWDNFLKLFNNYNNEGANHLDKVLSILKLEAKNILIIFIPIIIISYVAQIKLSPSEKWMVISFSIPLACLAVGLFLSRIVIRGGFSPWYRTMFLFYALVIGGVLLGSLSKKDGGSKKLYYIIGILIFAYTSISTIALYRSLHSHPVKESNSVTKLKNYFDEHSDECLGGVEGTDNLGVAEINIILYKISCERGRHLKPAYFSISNDALIKNNLLESDAAYSTLSSLHPTQAPKHIELLHKHFTKLSQSDYWASRAGTEYRSQKYGCVQSKPTIFSNLKIDFFSPDIDPIFYNTTILLSDEAGNGDLILLIGNRVEIWGHTANEPMGFVLKSSIYLNKISSHFSVNVKFNDRILINTQLVGSIDKSSKLFPRVLFICSFDNATPAEIIKNITYTER